MLFRSLTNPANTATQQAILKADLIDLLNQSFNMRANSTYNGLNQLLTGSTPVGFVSDAANWLVPLYAAQML